MDPKARFKSIREYYGLSMVAFGEKIGLSASGVSAIEYGTRNLGEKHVKLILAAFPDVNENWLRTGEGEMFSSATDDAQAIAARVAREYGADPLLRAFMTTYFQLSESKRALLLEIVESFTAALADALSSGRPAPDFSEFVHGHGDVIAAARSASPIPAEDSLSS